MILYIVLYIPELLVVVIISYLLYLLHIYYDLVVTYSDYGQISSKHLVFKCFQVYFD